MIKAGIPKNSASRVRAGNTPKALQRTKLHRSGNFVLKSLLECLSFFLFLKSIDGLAETYQFKYLYI
jgi:hypothetical protein